MNHDRDRQAQLQEHEHRRDDHHPFRFADQLGQELVFEQAEQNQEVDKHVEGQNGSNYHVVGEVPSALR